MEEIKKNVTLVFHSRSHRPHIYPFNSIFQHELTNVIKFITDPEEEQHLGNYLECNKSNRSQ